MTLHFLGDLKVVLCYIFARVKESTYETKKNVFISLQKLFLFLRKSNFSILDVQISWCHQMSEHKQERELTE